MILYVECVNDQCSQYEIIREVTLDSPHPAVAFLPKDVLCEVCQNSCFYTLNKTRISVEQKRIDQKREALNAQRHP